MMVMMMMILLLLLLLLLFFQVVVQILLSVIGHGTIMMMRCTGIERSGCGVARYSRRVN